MVADSKCFRFAVEVGDGPVLRSGDVLKIMIGDSGPAAKYSLDRPAYPDHLPGCPGLSDQHIHFSFYPDRLAFGS